MLASLPLLRWHCCFCALPLLRCRHCPSCTGVCPSRTLLVTQRHTLHCCCALFCPVQSCCHTQCCCWHWRWPAQICQPPCCFLGRPCWLLARTWAKPDIKPISVVFALPPSLPYVTLSLATPTQHICPHICIIASVPWALSPLLCWHHHQHCFGIIAVAVVALV